MQARNLDGSYQAMEPFNQDKLEELLKDKKVAHVEVFVPTEKEIKRREAMAMATPERLEAKKRKKRKNKTRVQRKSRKRS